MQNSKKIFFYEKENSILRRNKMQRNNRVKLLNECKGNNIYSHLSERSISKTNDETSLYSPCLCG